MKVKMSDMLQLEDKVHNLQMDMELARKGAEMGEELAKELARNRAQMAARAHVSGTLFSALFSSMYTLPSSPLSFAHTLTHEPNTTGHLSTISIVVSKE